MIPAAIEEQGAATQDISRSVQQAAAGTSEVSTNITSVSSAAHETGQAAQMVHSSAGAMTGQSESLRQAVEDFIARIKAA